MDFDRIPGQAQLNSKRMYNYSPNYPMNYYWGRGITLSIPEHKQVKDFSTMGIGCCILGYANKIVNDAVKKEIDGGNMTSLNSMIENELAERLIEVHPYYDMVRYFKGGGEALASAVRVARCANKWGSVISIGYHGWSDWWLAGNIQNERQVTSHLKIDTHNGVPDGLAGTNIFSEHNDHNMLLEILQNGNYEYDAIVFEYARYEKPTEDFLKALKSAQDKGIILIADEVTTGWRYRFGGMHMDYMDILVPDIVVYGKAISNGYPFSCVIGKKEVMSKFLDTFISSTYWTESIGMAAALATINELTKINYQERNMKQALISQALKDELNAEISGIPGLLHYNIPNMTLAQWCDKMLGKGYVVTNNLYLSFDHSWNDINAFVGAL